MAILIIIDQGAYDYFERYRPLFKYGFKELLDNGVNYTNVYHDHVPPTTAAGHASIATGTHPAISGMIGNQWFDRISNKEEYCTYDEEHKISPKNLLVPTFGDELKKNSPDSKIYSISGKDRGAVILGGKSADRAYWYDVTSKGLATSSYYNRSTNLPIDEWLNNFKPESEKILNEYFEKGWLPFIDYKKQKEFSNYKIIDPYKNDTFPHTVGLATLIPDKSFYESFLETPFIDQLVLEASINLVEKHALGNDNATDLLTISLSALDTIGHKYGPNSYETLDTLLRIDYYLEIFLKKLKKLIHKKELLIALTADHGVMPLPEYLNSQNKTKHSTIATRESFNEINCIKSVRNITENHFKTTDLFLKGFYLNEITANKNNLELEKIRRFIANKISNCPSVERVLTKDEILSHHHDLDPILELYKNSFNIERSPDIFIQRKKFHLEKPITGTTHLSPYEYDRHVPFILWGKDFSHKVITSRFDSRFIAQVMKEQIN